MAVTEFIHADARLAGLCNVHKLRHIFAHAGDKGGLQKVPYLPEQCMLGKGGVFTPS